jgi:type IV pilus assembly protein PilV
MTRHEAGFTLMEVLVTVVILSIGLLGVAGLQYNSLKGNKDAMHAAQAVVLAMEAADRVRANRPGVWNGNSPTNSEYDLITSAGTNPGCISSGCNTAQLAQTDAFEWITKVADQLPGGVGVICRDSTPYDGSGGSTADPWDPECDGVASPQFAIKVAWDHDKDPSTVYQVFRMSLIP